MSRFSIATFCVAFCIFVLTDMIWLQCIAKTLYFKYYSPWLNIIDGKLQLLWWAAILVYVLIALSAVVFVMPLAEGSVLKSIIYGAILGGVVYGVYDFTCLAIFKDFPIGMGLIDWVWGMVLYAWGTTATLCIIRYLQ